MALKLKLHMIVSTNGHIDHGKTSLTAALTRFLALFFEVKVMSYDAIDSAPEERKSGITIHASHVNYQTEHRHVSHVDCPGHSDYIKNCIVGLGGGVVDLVIMVIAANDGPMPQTREHIILCRSLGIKNIVVFINKVDLIYDKYSPEDAVEMLELIQGDAEELLALYGYDSSKVKFVFGSATAALSMDFNNPTERDLQFGRKPMEQLVAAIDQTPLEDRSDTEPFLMYVEQKIDIPGRGPVVTGRIARGSVKAGDTVEIAGYEAKPIKAVVTEIESFRKVVEIAHTRQDVGILLRMLGGSKIELTRGHCIAAPNTVTVASEIVAKIILLSTLEGGRRTGFKANYKPQICINAADVTSTVISITNADGEEIEIALPGDQDLTIKFSLHKRIAVRIGNGLILREGGKTVGYGYIILIS